jgi:aminoglycoside phosphotransferase (APT) family kinase protein
VTDDDAGLRQQAPPGIEVGGVLAWFQDWIPDLTLPLRFDRPSVGRSNLTFVVTDGSDHRWVLRRPPLHGVLQSAHDMRREYRIISALAGAGFRVPATVGFCDDHSVTGADFYVMDYVEGHTVATADDAERFLPNDARTTAAMELMETLAELHLLNVETIGLADLGRHHGYFERQLRRWHTQWHAAKSRELPAAEAAHERLAASIPDQQRTSVVHGDYRIDNVRVDTGGRVLAVLDWELCTLGDPLADLGTVLSAWEQPDDPPTPFAPRPSTVPGFPPRSALLERYAAASGLDTSAIDFYMAFSTWKHAMIMEGVYTRYAAGAYGTVDPATADLYARQAAFLAELAHETSP